MIRVKDPKLASVPEVQAWVAECNRILAERLRQRAGELMAFGVTVQEVERSAALEGGGAVKMRVRVVGEMVMDEEGVLLATCPNTDAAGYVAAALDLMTWVREQLKHREDICIRIEKGLVEVGTLRWTPDSYYDVDGRALTLDAAVREALDDPYTDAPEAKE